MLKIETYCDYFIVGFFNLGDKAAPFERSPRDRFLPLADSRRTGEIRFSWGSGNCHGNRSAGCENRNLRHNPLLEFLFRTGRFAVPVGFLALGIYVSGAGGAIAACQVIFNDLDTAEVDCIGDFSGGLTPPFLLVNEGATVNVDIYGLTSHIAPAPGTIGVDFVLHAPDGEDGDDGDDGDDGLTGINLNADYDGDDIDIETSGTLAHGINISSLGGDGGNGSGGGEGGIGADGGHLYAYTDGSVETNGLFAMGIFLHSRGGNGGDGGDDGGDGGAAGDGGSVRLINGADITTLGIGSAGIYARSAGGNGGIGGDDGGIWASAGGGDRAAPGGLVWVDNEGAITTQGSAGIGILAQSIGGFGGSGGSAGGLFAFGGDPASAGSGGTAIVTNAAAIETHGNGAHAILVQSIGGGGGSGGSGAGLVGLGSEGSVGGDGGNARIENDETGTIATHGDRSIGLFAQSIGGGGGDGGNAVGLFSLGGNGSEGGNAGNVDVENAATVETEGKNATAIFAQSVGGGGGNGGFSVSIGILPVSIGGSGGTGGDGGDVHVDNEGDLKTGGEGSNAIFAQSVGGGGGKGGLAVSASPFFSLAIGGSGGDGGFGGSVTVNESSDIGTLARTTITTTANSSAGIVAQSVGGGGGNGGTAVSVAASLVPLPASSISIGGGGGLGGDSGTVIVNYRGLVDTSGESSHGIIAQSVGGGGGSGGGSVSVAASAGSFGLGVSLGGGGGFGGSGGDVEVNLLGGVLTAGAYSHGVLAQSVGGGGGDGGYAVSATAAIFAGSVTLGGGGGIGGGGGDVTVTTSPDLVDSNMIRTLGDGSIGLLAQSVGGGGGSGGFAGSFGIGGASLGVALGGGGGLGATGGTIDVSKGVEVSICGNNASGITAQSIGGGGGTGGNAVSGSLGLLSGSVSLGGSGGGGLRGDNVTITNAGAIVTQGLLSNGILGQSIGGGGGNGGNALAFSAAISVDNIPALAASVGIGGEGGIGGDGQLVRIANTASVETHGTRSHAIVGQSIGGGGGTGGYAATGALAIGSGTSVTVSVGGSGGVGGDGGKVTIGRDENGNGVGSDTMIVTHGDGANGIHAQSVGGGGGDGGTALSFGLGENFTSPGLALNIGVAVGGSGVGGGHGGIVDVYNGQSIRTLGDNATAIFAQSVGGGGGSGGNAVTALATFTDANSANSREVSIGVTVGGGGGGGGSGGQVAVHNTRTIVTGGTQLDGEGEIILDGDGNPYVFGASSHGIYAQSVGGGGGVGGRANTINLVTGKGCTGPCPSNAKVDVKVTVAVGGSGGAGGNGGWVTVTNDGAIETNGDVAAGIFAQSVGGGGGEGGNGNLGTKDVLPSEFGVLLILANKANTKFYSDLSVAVGGSAGASGYGGQVTVATSAGIVTHGSNSDGIFAQSIGGGGGTGGRAAIGATGKVGVGGSGGAAGNGGTVDVAVTDDAVIETTGTAAFGILAQSIGGGGGIAGNVNRLMTPGLGPIPSYNLGIGAAFGQGGGNGGDGGAVTVSIEGSVITRGDASMGVFAQSVGGGGGILGDLGNELVGGLNNWAVGSNGDQGDAGKVTVNLDGVIVTEGASATGLFAQSMAGSAGSGGGGNAGGVEITLASSVVTTGLGSVAIFAHSLGETSNGDIVISLNSPDGMVIGGASQAGTSGVGIFIADGAANSLTSNGLITTVGGVDAGYAILSGTGNETVISMGIVTGAFDLGTGVNSFENTEGAVLNFGITAKVGSANVITNDGWMSPGGYARLMTTEITGVLTQGTTGTYGLDLDLERTVTGDESDLVLATEEITMNGEVEVAIWNAGSALPGEHRTLIAHSDISMTDNATELVAPPSAVAVYTLGSDATDMWLDYAIDFAPEGLNGNQRAFGEHVNAVQLAGGSEGLEPVVEALFFLPDLEIYAAGLNQLSPEPYLANDLSSLFATTRFNSDLMSCNAGDAIVGSDDEEGCMWFAASAGHAERDATGDLFGFDQDSIGASLGVQGQVSSHIQAGMGLSWEKAWNTSGDSSSSDGQRVRMGFISRATIGKTSLSTVVSGGYDTYDVTRAISFIAADPYTLEGHQLTQTVSAEARLAHEFGNETLYFRPTVDIGLTRTYQNDLTERGNGPGALSIAAGTNDYFAVEPGLEIGGLFQVGDQLSFRPFSRVGLTYVLDGQDPDLTASFAGAPSGSGDFTITDYLDKTVIDVTLGLDIVGSGGVAARLTGHGQYGETVESYGGSLKLVAPL